MTNTSKDLKKRRRNGLKNEATYSQFVMWMSLPDQMKKPATQGEFSKQYHISEVTLSTWKYRDGFWEEVKRIRKSWGQELIPNVILGLYKNAKFEGKASEVKLFLQLFDDFKEKNDTTVNIPQLEALANLIKSIAEAK